MTLFLLYCNTFRQLIHNLHTSARMHTQTLSFAEACTSLLKVPTHVFQPAQLLSLFPEPMTPWLPAVPHTHLWGMHHHHAHRSELWLLALQSVSVCVCVC